MEELLKNISSKDLEKLKMIFSMIPGNEPKEVVTLRVFVDEYSNLIKQNRSRAYHISVMCAFKHLIDFFGKQKAIHEIGLKEIENFSSNLQQKVTRGYRVYFRTLKAAFNKAVEWGYVKENYFRKVKLPKRQKVNPMFITSDQLSAISSQIKSEEIKNFVVFAFYTGMRLDEIINLRWKNVDLEKRVITVGDENF
ncbi:MAG: site-specific integrase, partial [Bacteroidetes bacterium]|nr:site-specific integrase [Bacteroidota bacterium]